MPVVPPVEAAVDGVEVEGDDAALSQRVLDDRGVAGQGLRVASAPAGHDRSRAAPFEHDAPGIVRPVEAGRAIGHLRPAPRRVVDGVVGAEHDGLRRIAVADRVAGAREAGAHVGAGRAQVDARLAHVADEPAFEGQRRAVAEGDEDAARAHEGLQARAGPSKPGPPVMSREAMGWPRLG